MLTTDFYILFDVTFFPKIMACVATVMMLLQTDTIKKNTATTITLIKIPQQIDRVDINDKP